MSDSFPESAPYPLRRVKSKTINLNDEVDSELRAQIYNWINALPITRSKSISQIRIERDFADGCLVAEVIAQHHPKIVELHNYTHGCSLVVKKENWSHLRRKVFPKLGLSLTDELIENIIESKPGAVDKVLRELFEIGSRIEEDRREEEEEKKEKVELPLEAWREESCLYRRNRLGKIEFLIRGQEVVVKEEMDDEIFKRDEELMELRQANKILKSQVSRLQMTVQLKEDRLTELTEEISKYRKMAAQKLSLSPIIESNEQSPMASLNENGSGDCGSKSQALKDSTPKRLQMKDLIKRFQ